MCFPNLQEFSKSVWSDPVSWHIRNLHRDLTPKLTSYIINYPLDLHIFSFPLQRINKFRFRQFLGDFRKSQYYRRNVNFWPTSPFPRRKVTFPAAAAGNNPSHGSRPLSNHVPMGCTKPFPNPHSDKSKSLNLLSSSWIFLSKNKKSCFRYVLPMFPNKNDINISKYITRY